MATTTWIAGSGDWNTASNWSNGVPGAGDAAVFSTAAATTRGSSSYTVTGNGVAASLTLEPNSSGEVPVLAGTYTVGSLVDDVPSAFEEVPGFANTAELAFGSATIADGAQLNLAPGAQVTGGSITLSDGGIVSEAGTSFGSLGTLSGALTLTGSDTIAGSIVVSGPVGGQGVLHVLAGDVVLAGTGSSFAGDLQIGAAGLLYGDGDVPGLQVELATTGAAGTQSIQLGTGTLTLDSGVVVGTIDAATGNGTSEINASDQAVTVFADSFPLLYRNTDGHPTIVGGTTPYPETGGGEGPETFGSMTVQGGSGSVTVFGGNESGTFEGGTAGHNVLVAGANLSAYPAVNGGGFVQGADILAYAPDPILLIGGGDGDLLVATGTDNSYRTALNLANMLVAAGGAETLTGSGSTGQVLFFGGSGTDLIVAGAGRSTVVAGTGTATISGGGGTAAIFSGAGQDVILGGTGADYVQAGTGNATLFAGSGADLVGVVAGLSGGSLTVSGFRVGTDQLALQGYGGAMAGITNSQVTGGSTVLSLVDGTHITLLGVTNLGASSFV